MKNGSVQIAVLVIVFAGLIVGISFVKNVSTIKELTLEDTVTVSDVHRIIKFFLEDEYKLRGEWEQSGMSEMFHPIDTNLRSVSRFFKYIGDGKPGCQLIVRTSRYEGRPSLEEGVVEGDSIGTWSGCFGYPGHLDIQVSGSYDNPKGDYELYVFDGDIKKNDQYLAVMNVIFN